VWFFLLSDLKLTIRVDDIPERSDATQSRNLALVVRKHKAPVTLAICSGWLRDWKDHQSIYKSLYDEGLARIGCHGMYHEDFGGIGMVLNYGEVNHYFRALSIAETDQVLKHCQDFARSFFGKEYSLFITPGANHTGNLLPREADLFYEILKLNGFRALSHYPGPSGADPLIKVFRRTKDIYEIPFTIYVDFFPRGYFRNNYTPSDYERYVEATKDHIRMRFRNRLYVCLFLHLLNFNDKPAPEEKYLGGNMGGKYLDHILTWVKESYPNVDFVGMEDLIEEVKG
jgi:hypothetical protein